MTPSTIKWCRDHIVGLEVEHIGSGIHFVQEDNGPAIGVAIASWRDREGLAKNPRRRGIADPVRLGPIPPLANLEPDA
jgi:hypothetical protein